jgi:hypothetical protein
MVGFTQEQKCTDGSTDTLIFQSSVHPMLHWSVGPTCHIRRRLRIFSNPNFVRRLCPSSNRPAAAAIWLISGDPPRVRAPVHPSVVPRARRRTSPPRSISRAAATAP